ncbi:MAG: VanZ family protein [Bacteroidales bacterium]|nr:VanZ family protein [Bacteroidales bacterium]
MELFFQLFNPNIPIDVLLFAIGATTFASVVAWKLPGSDKCRRVARVWVGVYALMMLYMTVIHRTPGTEYRYNFTPLWSYPAMESGLVEVFYEKLFNIILFIPYGAMLAASFRQHKFRNALLAGVATSVGIELLQLATKTGMCETDDVIHNTIGCITGTLLSIASLKFLRKIHTVAH